MRTAAVVPLKSPAVAKSRLGDAVDRVALAQAMAADVLDALRRVAGLSEVLVVSRRPPAGDGVAWVPDAREAGHVPAARLGVAAALRAGHERVVLVPGDCPALAPEEVAGLLTKGPGVTVVPDRHGAGTNALVLAPPDAIAPAFGPGSLARHAALARAAGVPVRVAVPPSLLMDVDTPEDLDTLLAAAPPGSAPRTRRALERRIAC